MAQRLWRLCALKHPWPYRRRWCHRWWLRLRPQSKHPRLSKKVSLVGSRACLAWLMPPLWSRCLQKLQHRSCQRARRAPKKTAPMDAVTTAAGVAATPPKVAHRVKAAKADAARVAKLAAWKAVQKDGVSAVPKAVRAALKVSQSVWRAVAKTEKTERAVKLVTPGSPANRAARVATVLAQNPAAMSAVRPLPQTRTRC